MKSKSKLPSGVIAFPGTYKAHKKSRKVVKLDELPENVFIFPFDKLGRNHKMKYGHEVRYVDYILKYS